MKIDFEKIGIISSYFSDNIKELHVTKLLKLFYYLDFLSYKVRGSSVTNDIYLKLPYGPVPTAIKNEIDMLAVGGSMGDDFKSQLEKYIELESDADKFGKVVKNKAKTFNIRKLSNFEIDLIKNLIDQFKDTRAGIISNQTHREAPWKLTSNNAVIDYELAKELDIKTIVPKLTL
ncbi:MAG: Panacea domain-containing protein [Patescibacteria group bacterium]|jgi:uncharacterized phage-associated protein